MKYLPVLYLILILLSFFSVLPSSVLIYSIAAVVIAILFLIAREEREIKLSKKFLILAFLLILATRIIPYLSNQIPLGYDAGIYKYGIEHSLTEEWTKSTFTPIFNLFNSKRIFQQKYSYIINFIILIKHSPVQCFYVTILQKHNSNVFFTIFFLFS